jgi:hypothetical protein
MFLPLFSALSDTLDKRHHDQNPAVCANGYR